MKHWGQPLILLRFMTRCGVTNALHGSGAPCPQGQQPVVLC
jgi:hypothetical protein